MCDESQVNGKAVILNSIRGLDDKVLNVHHFVRGKAKGERIDLKFIVHLIIEALQQIWPEENGVLLHASQIKLSGTNGVSYMRLAADLLRRHVAPLMAHFVWATHRLNLVAEVVRTNCPLTAKSTSLMNVAFAFLSLNTVNLFLKKTSKLMKHRFPSPLSPATLDLELGLSWAFMTSIGPTPNLSSGMFCLTLQGKASLGAAKPPKRKVSLPNKTLICFAHDKQPKIKFLKEHCTLYGKM